MKKKTTFQDLVNKIRLDKRKRFEDAVAESYANPRRRKHNRFGLSKSKSIVKAIIDG